jgi:hypothetical protein
MLIGKHVALTARLGNAPSILNTIVKNRTGPENVTHNVAGSLAKGRA